MRSSMRSCGSSMSLPIAAVTDSQDGAWAALVPPLPQVRAEFLLLFRVDDHPGRGDHDQAADPVRVVKGEARPDPGPQGDTDYRGLPDSQGVEHGKDVRGVVRDQVGPVGFVGVPAAEHVDADDAVGFCQRTVVGAEVFQAPRGAVEQQNHRAVRIPGLQVAGVYPAGVEEGQLVRDGVQVGPDAAVARLCSLYPS